MMIMPKMMMMMMMMDANYDDGDGESEHGEQSPRRRQCFRGGWVRGQGRAGDDGDGSSSMPLV